MRRGLLARPPPFAAIGVTPGIARQRQIGEDIREKIINPARWSEVAGEGPVWFLISAGQKCIDDTQRAPVPQQRSVPFFQHLDPL